MATMQHPHIHISLFLSLTPAYVQPKALHTSGDSAGHLTQSNAVRSLPLPFPILPPSLLLLQAAFCGGMDSELRALQQPGQEYLLRV
eukprot:scaffold9330_cov117-Isochrysis_galbana.AAC.10